MKHGSLLVSLGLVLFLISPNAKAQNNGHPYHPGDKIVIDVTFDGPDAGKATATSSYLQHIGTGPDAQRQQNFTDGFRVNATPVGKNTFEITFVIPETAESGQWQVGDIQGTITLKPGATIGFGYSVSRDFQSPTFTIENPLGYTKPGITVVPHS